MGMGYADILRVLQHLDNQAWARFLVLLTFMRLLSRAHPHQQVGPRPMWLVSASAATSAPGCRM